MPKDGVQIQLDQASKQNLDKQFQALGTTIAEAGPKAIFKVLMKIKTSAQLYLTGRGHIVTSRLKNSIYVQMPNMPNLPDNQRNYTDNRGGSYDAEMKTVALKNENEGAVGTNVEYAAGIEFGFRPHTIIAKNAKVLGTPKTGFFGKKVQHPGYAGDSYLYRALKTVDVTKTVAEDMRNSLKFGKYLGGTNTKSGRALTNAD